MPVEFAGEKMLVGPIEDPVGGEKSALTFSAGFFRKSKTPPEPLLEGAVVAAASDGVVDHEKTGFCVGACDPGSDEGGLAKVLADGLDAQEKVGVCVFGVGLSTVGALNIDGVEENGFAAAEPSTDLCEPNPFVDGGL